MQSQEARPPYITFEVRAEEDRQATIDSGQYKTKDVDYVIVTPQGSKDRIDRNATEWFDKLAQDVREERFPEPWLRAFREKYAAWKEGREMPLEGTSVRNWPAVSPAQVKTLLDAHVKTIEDLAAANEETIGRIGMGGRALKSRAQEWLTSARDTGKQAEEIAALKQQNEDLRASLASFEQKLTAAMTVIDQLAPQEKAASGARKL